MNPLEKPFDILEQKIMNLIDYQLKKHIHPNMKLSKVNDIDLKLVKQLKSKYGIGGIILDVDETLRKGDANIPNCNKKWIEFMKNEFKVIVLSNGIDRQVEDYFKNVGIEYMSFCHKPLKKNFLRAADNMGIEPENVLVIGDDIVCDVYGGNRCGMITAIVEDVLDKDEVER